MRKILSAALAMFAVASASTAIAADKQWHVTGVINDGLATVFTCTNRSTMAQSVTVTVYNKAGGVDASGTIGSIAPQATVNFGSNAVVSFGGGIDFNLGVSTPLHSGSAVVSAPAKVYCTAFVIDPTNPVPTTTFTLPMFKSATQKGQ